STSRWVDYETHELLQVITDLEDERRWARLREGIWLAILLHVLVLSAITWIPRYVLKVPPVIDPFDAISKRKDLSYLDVPPDALKALQPKVVIKQVPQRATHIDQKTLQELQKQAPPPEPVKQADKQPELQTPAAPSAPAEPAPKTQSIVDAPQPAAVPAKPNFAMGSQNPADQLRQSLRGAAGNPGAGSVPAPSGSGLSRHPGAGGGGVQILSDTQGVDFNSWLHRWYVETEHTWDPLIPDEVNPPILKQGAVQIRFKVGPNGRIIEGSMVLEGRSGDTGLDRAAWGALTGSNYPPLPHDFHGPYLELRALFLYNERPPQ
ncbi:MAG TPA: cell envelope integrity protein TolA, partial [Terracidiphilus sp.]|nr:cell envelope integrity protein TolA [Terracidiphilus sp.]